MVAFLKKKKSKDLVRPDVLNVVFGAATGKVVATFDDYAAVYELFAGPLAEGLEATVPQHIRAVVEAVEKMTGEINERDALPPGIVVSVSQSAIADRLKIHASSVSRSVRQAIEQGYLIDENPGQGRLSNLMIGGRKLPNSQVLPAPNKLEEAFRAQDTRLRQKEMYIHARANELAKMSAKVSHSTA